MWLRKTITATSTATVLMTQLCKKRTALEVCGFISNSEGKMRHARRKNKERIFCIEASAPDAGSTLACLGSALGVLGAARRKILRA